MPDPVQRATCSCGRVSMEARRARIVATVCHCASCQRAGHLLEALPDAPPILNGDGGTPFVLMRKDRVDCVRGQEHLREHRLSDTTPTRRVVATCCNTFMFLDFTKGHWVTMLRGRLDGGGGPDRPTPVAVGALMLTWARMGFRTPRIDYVEGALTDGR